MPKSEKTVEAPAEAGDILLQWQGPEHIREVDRSDLGTYPDSETVLSWNPENNHICEVGLTEDEVQVLTRSGGSWAIVDENSPAPETEEEPKVELPTVPRPVETQIENAAAQVEPIDESASDQA